MPPEVETPVYYPPFLRDYISPIGATYNSSAIYCRVTGHGDALTSGVSGGAEDIKRHSL